VEIVDWEDITSDYNKYSKSFQILAYAYMLNATEGISQSLEAGIISFKNLQGDYFLKFGKKPSSRSRDKDHTITKETLDSFYGKGSGILDISIVKTYIKKKATLSHCFSRGEDRARTDDLLAASQAL